METQAFTADFAVRALSEDDLLDALVLCQGNPLFYRYHPPMATVENLRADLSALPPGKAAADKHFVGYFAGNKLVALLDLIEGYPAEKVAWIGFFMLAADRQGQGLGTALVRELFAALRHAGFSAVQLGTDHGNPQSAAFWRKNGFWPIREAEHCTVWELRL